MTAVLAYGIFEVLATLLIAAAWGAVHNVRSRVSPLDPW